MKLHTPLCLISLFCASVFSQETIRIPDVAFEEALIDLEIDTNGLNGNILVSDAKYVVNLNIEDPKNNKRLPKVHHKIKDLTGIEHFKNLKRLVCFGNEITKMDLSKNTELTFLNCSDNKISKIDVSNSPKLFFVSCDSNKLSSLKLGLKPELTELYANSNQLTSLDLKGCTALENIDVSANKLHEIIVDDTTASNIPEGWYKDETTVYTTELGKQPIVAEVKTIKKITPIEETVPDTPVTYDEEYKKRLVREYEQRVLNQEYLEKQKTELQKKHNIDINELSKWIERYSKLKIATSS